VIRRYQWIQHGYNFGRLADQEEGDDKNDIFKDYLMWDFIWQCTLQVNYHFTDYFVKKARDNVGNGVHNKVLTEVMNAPVNLFFDVTPIGTILRRFRDDMGVFREHFLHAPCWMVDMTTHFLTILYYYYLANCLEGAFVFMLGFMILKLIVDPYLAIDNQLHKVSSLIWTPITSYFHESMRGITVIRAFSQTDHILKKQYGLLDNSTNHMIAHLSSWFWVEVRSKIVCYYFKIVGMVAVVLLQGKAPNKVLLMLMFYSFADWIVHIFGIYQWMQRNLVRISRVYNLLDIPQEK